MSLERRKEGDIFSYTQGFWKPDNIQSHRQGHLSRSYLGRSQSKQNYLSRSCRRLTVRSQSQEQPWKIKTEMREKPKIGAYGDPEKEGPKNSAVLPINARNLPL